MLEIVWCSCCFNNFECEHKNAAYIFEKLLIYYIKNECKPFEIDWDEDHCEQCRIWMSHIKYLEKTGYLITADYGLKNLLVKPSEYFQERDSKGVICSGMCNN